VKLIEWSLNEKGAQKLSPESDKSGERAHRQVSKRDRAVIPTFVGAKESRLGEFHTPRAIGTEKKEKS